jgi:HEAT repeat protein
LGYGHNAGQWQQWWNGAMKDFPGSLRASREQGYLQQRQRTLQISNEQDRNLRQVYTETPAGARAALLLRFLQSSEPVMRVIGADKVYEIISVTPGNPPSAQAMQEVRDLLADPVPDVRAAAAHALRQDPASAALLMDQLKQETDDGVRVVLINALSTQQFPATISYFLTLLQPGTSTPVQIEIANAINGSAGLISRTPDLRRSVQLALLNAYNANKEPIKRGLRDAIILAIGELQDLFFKQVLIDAISSEKVPEIRRDALVGLGKLGLKDQSNYIAQFLDDRRTPMMRWAAATALQYVYDPAYIDALATRTVQDSDDSVKSAAWDTLQHWIDTMDAANLSSLSADLSDALNKHLVVQTKLVEKLKEGGTSDNLANAQDTLGSLLMDANKPSQAADQFQQAFEHYKPQGVVGVLDPLAQSTTTAMLKAGSWVRATNFASKIISDFSNRPQMGTTIITVCSLFSLEERKLAGEDDPNTLDIKAENELYQATLKMQPPLVSPYPEQMNGFHENAQKRAAATRQSSQ